MQQTLSWPRRVAAVLSGGFLGTISRYLLGIVVQHVVGKNWPYDILLINVTGALVLALITVLADAALIGTTRRLFINVGFLGAYTTFSSLALGDVQLFAHGQALSALLYLCSSLFGGILAVLLGEWAGLTISKRLKGKPVLDTEIIPAAEDLDLQDDVLTQ